MAYRVTLETAGKGMKFDTKEEAVDALWPFFEDKMEKGEFEKFLEDHIEEA